jgi:hypothetical protein
MEKYPTDEPSWVRAFEEKIKTKSYESFSLLLFDWKLAEEHQKTLLSQLLFEDHLSPQNWSNYLSCMVERFQDKKSHIQRIINKALELLDERKFLNDRHFLQIHLFSIELKR